MKTILPSEIKTVRQAKMLLKKLHTNGESFHPEDDAHTIVWDMEEQPTPEQCDHLNKLMEDIYNLPGNDGRHVDLAFDPCGYLLDLETPDKSFSYKDKTGRGFKATFTLVEMNNMPIELQDERNWDDESLNDWAREAEEGDEWENSASKYICTKS